MICVCFRKREILIWVRNTWTPLSPFPRNKAPQNPHNTNQCNNFWCSLKEDFIVVQKTDAVVDWEACRSQASTYGATIHRPAPSVHSPARSLPVRDCVLARVSQKLSCGRDTRMRSLAHIGNIFLASVTWLLSASFLPKVRTLVLCSPAMFRLALGVSFSVCSCFVVLSLRDYLFFKWRWRNLSFISKSYDLCYNSNKAVLDEFTCFWGGKESIQAKWGNTEAQNTFYSLNEKIEWVIKRNIFFSFFNETLISINSI